MLPLIKICGVKTIEEVEVARENKVSFYGLVFYQNSPRNINFDKAEMIIKQAPKFIFPIAVTVNPDESLVQKLVNIGIKNIQLHGKETVEKCLFLKKKFNVKIFKGIGLATEQDIDVSKKYSKIADWIIFDKKDDYLHGGTGKTFDWHILSKVDINVKYFVSGGLTHKNVLKALDATKADGVDVSSGVENNYGVKSKELISKFCNNVRLFKR